MRGYVRNKNRKQSQGEQLFQEQRFDAGWIPDLPASDLPKGGLALLENFVGFPEYLEGRSGSQKYSDQNFPGFGAIHSVAQHPKSKKWVLHRGSGLFYADAAQSSWANIVGYGSGFNATITGDTLTQLSALSFVHATNSNTNAGTLYWNLTDTAGTRTLNVYKDSGKTQLVATGSRVGDGVMFLHQQNNSGLGGMATVTYTANDTNTNTFTAGFNLESSFSVDAESNLEPVGDDFYLFVNANDSYYLDLTGNKFYRKGGSSSDYGVYSVPNVAYQDPATPYGYRYIYTWTRIVNATTGALDSSANRVTGNLLFEGPGNSVGGGYVKEYGEIWLANAIDGSNPATVTLTQDSAMLFPTSASSAAAQYTHVSLYRTTDIGDAGVDPVNGSGKNREIYIWVGDYDNTLERVTDNKTDEELRSAYMNGFGLKTRFWTGIPSGCGLGAIGNSFLYAAKRGESTVYYSQIGERRFIGFYNPAYQFFKLEDAARIISKSPDMISYICTNKTYISNPNSYFDAGGAAVAPIYVLNHLTVASENIGVTDWGSFARMDNAFIAHCTDHTIRIWNSSYWSDDIASRRVNQIIRQTATGSVGIYGAGAYYLFCRTDTGQTNNNLCLRYGFSRESGFGWSKVSGASWVVPGTYVGACQIIDANNLQRIIVFDAVDNYTYWIETFTAYTGSSTTKVFKDKVAVNGTGGTNIVCTARFREFTASDESLDLFHKESYIYDRPYDEATGYPSGFSRTLKAYTDGSTTAAATITAAAAKGDLQFFDKVSGNRIQMEVQFATSGARLTGIATLCDVFDRAAIGSRPSDGSEAASQLALASNMKYWLTRPVNLLNRVTGNFSSSFATITNTAGPDGKNYGLQFGLPRTSFGAASFVTTVFTDYTIHFWIKGPYTLVSPAGLIFIAGPTLTLLDSGGVLFNSNTSIGIFMMATVTNITISSIASGWHDFWITRSGATISVYQNGAFVNSAVAIADAIGGSTFYVDLAGSRQVYDVRMYNVVIPASAIAYYYADVNTTLQGNKVLPIA